MITFYDKSLSLYLFSSSSRRPSSSLLSFLYGCCRIFFTFSSTSPEPPGQFQSTLTKTILGWRGFYFFQLKDPTLLQWEIITKLRKYIWRIIKNHWANFNQTWHKTSLREGNSCLCKWRAPSFSKERSLRKSENTLMNPEQWGQFQPNLAQSIIGWRECMGCFIQKKGPALFQGEIIMK